MKERYSKPQILLSAPGAMLRCSNACLRYLGTGTRFVGRFPSDTLLKTSALPHSRCRPFRRDSSSAAESSLLDAYKDYPDQLPDKQDKQEEQPRFKITRIKSDELSRNARLSEGENFRRNQRKRTRRVVHGDSAETALLMELSKSRSLPPGITSSAVSKELQWVKDDPKELAIRIAHLLNAGQAPLAVAMLRNAQSTRIECSAAWNRLMSYCFRQGAPLAAFKFFNDMKKRGRNPTERTYTIMLRGLCLRSRQSGVKPVELAQKIYQQLLSKNSGVKPSLYHHHAMLEVCGTYHDMDTLWKVIGELPATGINKPNAQTYTVILLALRNSFDNDMDSIPEDKMELRKEKRKSLVLDAKRIWADVINLWRKRELDVDNQLLSAMVSVLSDPLDELNSYNVLALIHQTMGIPILISKPEGKTMKGSAQGNWEAAVRSSKDRPNYTPWRPLDSESALVEELPTEYGPVDADEWVEDLEGVFDPVEEKDVPLLVPDNMTLHNILTVCRILTKGTRAGKEYWDLLTSREGPYKVEPDLGSCHEYLRLLRISRSSHTVVELISQQMIPRGLAEGRTFHIAMSCCLRDRTNPNVLINAQSLLMLMKDTLVLPDPRPLKSFVDLCNVLAENPQWLLGLKGLEDIDQSTTNLTILGRNLRWALHKTVVESLEPHIERLYESMENELELDTNSPSKISSNTVNGFFALEFMIKTREMLDKLLGPRYEDIIMKSDRDWISPIALKLRKFSNPEVAKKLSKAQLRPLTHHYSSK